MCPLAYTDIDYYIRVFIIKKQFHFVFYSYLEKNIHVSILLNVRS